MQLHLMLLVFGSFASIVNGATEIKEEILIGRSMHNAHEWVPDGYGFEALQWDLPTPDGGRLLVNGSVQDALELVKKRFPKYNGLKKRAMSPKRPGRSLIAPRDTDFSGASYNCDWTWADLDAIFDGIDYLYNVNGQPTNGPGPGNCGRVSCSYNSAIWWCNDNTSPKTLYSYGSIADGALHVVESCWWTHGGGPLTKGQAFHYTNWNVIVRDAWC